MNPKRTSRPRFQVRERRQATAARIIGPRSLRLHSWMLAIAGLIAVLRLAPAASLPEDHSPAAELASFQIAEGFDVNLFASEADGVVKPIQMRFDARGRLWVIGSTVYPQLEPGRKPNDKVLILEDTNGDGRSDKTTVFADGLMIPTGIELGHGGAYIGHGTELLFLKDTDGDDKADERRVVLRGFGTGDNHQNINSFAWGPGGELWLCQGLHIRSHVETPWGIVNLEQAGIWRFRPHLLKLEGFYGSQNEPQNPWGFAFTDWGEPIVLAGNNHSIIYPVPGLTSIHRDLPPALIWKNGNGRKMSGGEIVGTAHFPESWQGALVIGGYLNNAIWSLKISDDGSGFVLEDLPPLIKSTSRAFRPVDVRFGPEGALYLCDWSNPIIGHYQTSFRHPDRDKTHGRIWRVTAKGRPLTKPPQLADAPILELLNQLQSPDRWTRHFAKRVLADSSREEVVAALDRFVAQPDLPEQVLKEALGVYQSHEFVATQLLARLCRAEDAGARAYAASVTGLWADRLSDPLALLRPLVADEHPRVRLHAMVASTYVPAAEAVEVAAIATDFASDKFLDYAWKQTVFALKPRWLPAFKAGQLEFEGRTSRLAALVRADGTPDTLEAVRVLANSGNLTPNARAAYLRLLTEVGTADDLAFVLNVKDPTLQTILLPSLADAARLRNLRPSGDLVVPLQSLMEQTSVEMRAEALHLAGVWRIEAFRSAIDRAALDPTAPVPIRRRAITALASLGGEPARQALTRIAASGDETLRGAAIAGLAALDLQKSAELAASILAASTDDAVADEILTAFFQRRSGMDALHKVLAQSPPSKTAARAGLKLMNSMGRQHTQLAGLLADAAGFSSYDKQLGEREIAAFAEEVREGGEFTRGEQVYRREELGCVKCHAVNGEGGNIGPDLSSLGTAQPLDFIIGAVIDPQKEIKEGYTSTLLTTKEDEEHQGYVLRETKEEVVLRDLVQDREVRLRRDAIVDRRQAGSAMPEGLADTLTRAEFRDLIRYLSELGKPK